jgi:hypothetical protein
MDRDVTFRRTVNTGIGAGTSPALPTGGECWPQTPAEPLAMDGLERVRALGRAARSANESGCCQSDGPVESSARQSPHARRRPSEKRLQFVAGGPSPLTEDRQKTRHLAEGMHGTRNTVPSRAPTQASEDAHCRPQRRSWMEQGVRRPELPEFAEGTVPVLAHSGVDPVRWTP